MSGSRMRKTFDVGTALAEAEKLATPTGAPTDTPSLTSPSEAHGEAVDTSAEEDASLSGINESDDGGDTESTETQSQDARVTEGTGEPNRDAQQADPEATFPFALQRKGKEYNNLSYKDVIAYAQMGMNHDIRGKELNQMQTQLVERENAYKEREQTLQPIVAFDEWMRSDPQLAALVEQTVWNYQQGLQGQQVQQTPQAPAQSQQAPQQAQADPRVEEMYHFVREMQEKAATEQLDREMDKIRQLHPSTRWDVPDPNDAEGRTPEDKIYDFMADHNISDPETAYRALFYDSDLAQRTAQTQQSVTQKIQQKHRQGAVLSGGTPSQSAPPSFNFENLRGKRPGDIAAHLQGALERGQLPL